MWTGRTVKSYDGCGLCLKSLLILAGLQPGERAITLLRNRFNGFVEGKQIKPLKRFSVHTFPLSTGLKPGENEMTFEANHGYAGSPPLPLVCNPQILKYAGACFKQ